jgi:hypothetical protein
MVIVHKLWWGGTEFLFAHALWITESKGHTLRKRDNPLSNSQSWSAIGIIFPVSALVEPSRQVEIVVEVIG